MTTPTFQEDPISIICARLETLCGALTGLQVFDPPLPNLETGHLPALWFFTGQADDDSVAAGPKLIVVNRTIRAQLAIIPTGQGNPRERESLCRPWIQTVKTHLAKYPRLNRLDFVRNMVVTGDSGVVLLPEYGGKFIGAEIRLQITYHIQRTIAPGE